MTFAEMSEVMECFRMACWHGYPVRVCAGDAVYDGWVRGSKSPSSVTVSLGEQDYDFEWAEVESVSFFTPLAERLTGAWLREHLGL